MKTYNITFKPHHRTSLWLYNIPNNIVFANNKASAKELGQAIVRDYYENKGYVDPDYMTRQYIYIIEREDI